MNKIEQMIKELCPEGVKWVKLGEVCEIKGRIGFRGYTRNDQVSKGDGVISLSPANIYNGSLDYESCTYITWEKYNESPEIKTFNGDIIFCKTASVGKVAVVKNLPCEATINPQLVVLKKITCNTNYLYYILAGDIFQQTVLALAGTGSVPNVGQGKLSDISIPLPPLAIQEQIVTILDKFESMRNNLEKELSLRRKQYDAVLDKIFGFTYDDMVKMSSKGDFEIKSLDELGVLTTGRRFVRSDIKESGVPCIHYGDMYTYYGTVATQTKTFLDEDLANKLRFADPGDVVIVAAGENDLDIGVGLGWLGEERVVCHDACVIYKHNMNPKYVSYYLRCNNYHGQIRKYVSSGKISSISAKSIGKAFIPFYSRKEQDLIVSKLDKFEALISNIERELELRTKQYEYYREKLLTF